MLPIAILSGGLATRLHPITKNIPKSMIEICGMPFVHWQTKLLVQAGFTKLVYCVSHKAELIERYLGDGSKYGVRIRFSKDEPFQLGTGGAIIKALPHLGNDFMVIYGDSYLPINYSAIEKDFFQSRHLGSMTVYSNQERLDQNNVQFKNGKLIRYEKGSNAPDLSHIDYGLSCFNKQAFSTFPAETPIDLAEIFLKLTLENQLAGREVFDRFYEVGSKQGIQDFTEYIGRNASEL